MSANDGGYGYLVDNVASAVKLGRHGVTISEMAIPCFKGRSIQVEGI
jgi:hypothetical protein